MRNEQESKNTPPFCDFDKVCDKSLLTCGNFCGEDALWRCFQQRRAQVMFKELGLFLKCMVQLPVLRALSQHLFRGVGVISCSNTSIYWRSWKTREHGIHLSLLPWTPWLALLILRYLPPSRSNSAASSWPWCWVIFRSWQHFGRRSPFSTSTGIMNTKLLADCFNRGLAIYEQSRQ